ncbi:hypothetical protein [Paraburkholderia caballeronis]|uniref:Uncharacterized protein n=1 Tax=Paraburkholderia caballeronis TaxID=416943 RepID=A0A1H7F729_9BURK|nr:hypothetical protein [Paraburkholderia caballeronis]PXW23999.1 hypothetical protein C7403_108158 [Paraburkholderia caballeronis]PXW99763.1 hypothetical protein C7407_108158 [Paraburkholderia caballeronis]RAJ96717.1 hypothetical protein C7409_108158 [Paraburkholderia caballeronis]TDV15749.1 hypothetical protein C7408_106206 [Paraburkholderia caballeronis]TDV18004.1 hypothetical protein C7406_105206 [Paraburkholderia caballeronis]
MALDTNQIRVIAEVIRTAPTLPDAAASWRARYPGVRAMRISAAEMRDETPALAFGARRVYFAMSDGVCVSVTREAGEADMLIFTEDGTAHGDR